MVTLFYCIVAYLSTGIVNSQPSNYIVLFNDLMVGDYVIITGTDEGYLKDNEDGTTLISSSTFDDTAIWEVRDDFIHGIQFKNTKTGNYIKGNGANCIVGSLAGYYGNSGSWTQLISGTFMNDAHDKCCCVDSANDNEITHVYCKSNTCAQFVFHVIRPSLRTRITSFDNLAVNDHVIIESASGFCGYLTESDSKLITSAFGTIWQVTNDYNVAGIEFKNTKTGNYIKGDGTNCFVGSIIGSGDAASWIQAISGTFENDKQHLCCCVNEDDDNKIMHDSCSNSCAKFLFHVILSGGSCQ